MRDTKGESPYSIMRSIEYRDRSIEVISGSAFGLKPSLSGQKRSTNSIRVADPGRDLVFFVCVGFFAWLGLRILFANLKPTFQFNCKTIGTISNVNKTFRSLGRFFLVLRS